MFLLSPKEVRAARAATLEILAELDRTILGQKSLNRLILVACLARGDAAGAVSALSRLGFFRCGELQSLARLAEAHLRLEPAHPAGLFHKAVALAALCKRVNDQGLDREELPVTGHAWDAGQLQDVAARAAAWLEGYGIEN